MLPIERRNQIRKLIQEKQSIKISELSKLFSVSEMTIHRDLKPLIAEELIVKTFGGVALNNQHQNNKHDQACAFCHQAINNKLEYRLMLTDNTNEVTCCAHCGLLRHRQLGSKVSQAICLDFLRQTTISALLAWYVFDTSLDIGCCQPQVLTFEEKEHANQFITGFGGEIYPFSKAIEVICEKMNGEHKNCHK
jgi:DeoR/GlpR family transcriptional regulator of sugar metabolism